MKKQGIDQRTLAAFMLLGGVCVTAINWKWFSFSPDLSALYMAARFFAAGQYDLIYAHPAIFFDGTPPGWLPYLPALGLENEVPLPYLYPPLWAAIFSPLAAAVSPTLFFQIIGTVLIAALPASVVVAWRLARGFGVPLWVWVMTGAVLLATSVIAFAALMHLQIQIAVAFLILLAFERQLAGRSATAGAILALAAAMKLAPAALLLLFIFDRDWRACESFAIVGAALGLASLAAGGIALHIEMLNVLSTAATGLWISPLTMSADMILYPLAGLLGLAPAIDLAAEAILIPQITLIAVTGKALLIAGIIWMLRRTAEMPRAQRVPVRLFALSLLFNMFGPLGWAHYYLLQLFLLPMFAGFFAPRQAMVFLALVATLSSWPIFILQRQQSESNILAIGLNIAVMAALFFIAIRGPRPARASPGPAALAAE